MPSPGRNGIDRKAGQQAPKRSILTMLLLALAAVLFLDGVAGDRGWLANRRARLEFEREQQALGAARQRNDNLREEIRRLRTDPSAIEELARRELGMMKPGETVFIVKDVQKNK
jgi:cell division protein FtsB